MVPRMRWPLAEKMPAPSGTPPHSPIPSIGSATVLALPLAEGGMLPVSLLLLKSRVAMFIENAAL